MPIVFEDQIIAVTEIINKDGGIFTREDEEVLAAFTSLAGVSLNNALLYGQVSDSPLFFFPFCC
jgi:GAF domain-containing protein